MGYIYAGDDPANLTDLSGLWTPPRAPSRLCSARTPRRLNLCKFRNRSDAVSRWLSEHKQEMADFAKGCLVGGQWGFEWGASTGIPYAATGGAVVGCIGLGGAAVYGSDYEPPDWPHGK